MVLYEGNPSKLRQAFPSGHQDPEARQEEEDQDPCLSRWRLATMLFWPFRVEFMR